MMLLYLCSLSLSLLSISISALYLYLYLYLYLCSLSLSLSPLSIPIPIPMYPSDQLKFDEKGLITAVVQHWQTRQILMVAWMNAESLRLTQQLGETVFWSRSRQELWHKGATSGNTQAVRQIWVDCDGDTLVLLVEPNGPACHTGEPSCFFRQLDSL